MYCDIARYRKIKMEAIKIFVSECCPSITEENLDSVMKVLEELGVDNVEDLNLLEPEKDLAGVLKIVQIRKLKRKIDSRFNQEINEKNEVVTSSENITNEKEKDDDNVDCASLVETIPFNKLSKSSIMKLEKGERLTAKERREAVRVIADGILHILPAPRKCNLELVAVEVVRRYPNSFKDDIGNASIGLGHSSLLCQLIARVENCRRTSVRHVKRTLDSKKTPSPKRLADEYGCANFQPDLPEGETLQSLKEKQDFLILEFQKAVKAPTIIEDYMKITYTAQRLSINNKMSLSEIKREWPFLTERKYFFIHANELLGFDPLEKFREAADKKLPEMIKYLKSEDCYNIFSNRSVDLHPPHLYFLELLTSYFQEDIGVFMKIYEEDKSLNEVVDEVPVTPFIACIGNPYSLESVCTVIVDREKLEEMIPLNDALAMWFLSFYVFNLIYPKECCATLEFIQRVFYDINPTTKATKMEKRFGKRVSMHPKVLKLVNKIKDFNSQWAL